MKNVFRFSNQLMNEEKSFSNFSANEILSTESMNRVRGGENGDGYFPPPPKP